MSHFQLIILASLLAVLHATVEFTNLKCTTLDKEFADFEYCLLKSVNRSYKYASVKVKLYKIPITNVTVNASVMKKANGYKPFLYNFTLDACKFLLSSRKNPVTTYFYNLFLDYSNMNHTCPYDHDLLLEKLPVSHINNQVTNILPVPHGEYGFFTTWIAYNIPRATANFYVKIF